MYHLHVSSKGCHYMCIIVYNSYTHALWSRRILWTWGPGATVHECGEGATKGLRVYRICRLSSPYILHSCFRLLALFAICKSVWYEDKNLIGVDEITVPWESTFIFGKFLGSFTLWYIISQLYLYPNRYGVVLLVGLMFVTYIGLWPITVTL